MEINTGGLLSSPMAPKPSAAASTHSSQSPVNGPAKSASAYTPSTEWLLLLDQLKLQPDVREDRVAAATLRFRQGYYATAESATQTAEAMLNSVD